jgi:transposase-like protein
MIDTKICFECGSDKHIHQHHVIPKSLGGTKTIPLCETCHGRVHQKDLVKFNSLAKEGIKRYVANGGKLGRKEGSTESIETFMSKPVNVKIKQLVEQGYSIRKIAKMIGASSKTVVKMRKSVGISTSTVVKVRKQLGIIGKKSIVNINSNKWI